MGRLFVIALPLIIAVAACAPTDDTDTARPLATRSTTTAHTSSTECATITDRSAKYYCWLRLYGFTVDGDTEEALMVAGTTLCQGLRKGGTPKEGVAVIYRTVPNITEKQAGNLLSAAQFGLCPETL